MLNDSNNRIEFLIFSSFFEVFELDDLFNIFELRIQKSKKKSRKFQNKKNLMIKIEKTTIKFTKRNFFEFEFVKQNIEITIKRVKKKIVNEFKTNRIKTTRTKNENKAIIKNKNKTQSNAITRNRKFVTRKVTRSTISISQIIDILNDEISDDEFNDLKFNNDDFHASKNENEMTANE